LPAFADPLRPSTCAVPVHVLVHVKVHDHVYVNDAVAASFAVQKELCTD